MKYWLIGLSMLISAVFVAAGIGGCASTVDAYKAAEGLEETAFVMNQHYLALVREANALAEAGALSGSSLAKAQEVVRESRPVLNELSNMAKAYQAAATAENEQALTAAIAAAAVHLSNLVTIISAARGSAQSADSPGRYDTRALFAPVT